MTQILAADARSLFDSDPQALLLDVREAAEVARARPSLPGDRQLHIPMGTLPARLHEIPRDRPVVCLCLSGARSAQVVAFLRRQGYDKVYNLAGGILAWSALAAGDAPKN